MYLVRFLLFLLSFIPSVFSQSLQYNIENFSNSNTESINYGDTSFSSNFKFDHSSILFKNINDCNNVSDLGLKTSCTENSDSLWIRGYKVFNSNSDISFFSSLGMKFDYSLLNNISESSIIDNQSLTSLSFGVSYNLSRNLSISAESSANNNFSNFLMFSNNPLLDYKKINHSIGLRINF
jgi:hypothetical protein